MSRFATARFTCILATALAGGTALMPNSAEAASISKADCPADRRHYHAALYDALAGALLLARLAVEPALADRSIAWLLAMSTLNPEKRDALRQKELF